MIVDAPATGHSVPLLAHAGHVAQDAAARAAHRRRPATCALLLGDPKRAAVAIVTRAEEMAVNETLELATALMRIGVTLLPVDRERRRPVPLHARRGPHALRAEPSDVPPSMGSRICRSRASASRASAPPSARSAG